MYGSLDVTVTRTSQRDGFVLIEVTVGSDHDESYRFGPMWPMLLRKS